MSIYHEIDVYGKHILQKVNNIENFPHAGEDDKGRMLYSRSDSAIYYGTSTAWVKLPSIFDIFPRHTKVLMASYPLPPGFEIWNATEWNNQMVMFTSDLDLIGTVPGTSTWTITGLQNSDKHYHGNKTGRPSLNVSIGKSEIYGVAGSITHRHNIIMDGQHTHAFDGSWKPTRTHYLPVNYVGI